MAHDGASIGLVNEVNLGKACTLPHNATTLQRKPDTMLVILRSSLSQHLHSECDDENIRCASRAIVIATSSRKERRIASAVGGVSICRTETWYILKSKP